MTELTSRTGFTQIPNSFFKLDINAYEFKLLCFIASWCDLNSKRLSISYIVIGTGLKRSTVQRAKQGLLDKGLIEVKEICPNTSPRIVISYDKTEAYALTKKKSVAVPSVNKTELTATKKKPVHVTELGKSINDLGLNLYENRAGSGWRKLIKQVIDHSIVTYSASLYVINEERQVILDTICHQGKKSDNEFRDDIAKINKYIDYLIEEAGKEPVTNETAMAQARAQQAKRLAREAM